ncbi:MAG: hypothetical protein ACFFAL_07980 [Promethearchaeota archaeon]
MPSTCADWSTGSTRRSGDVAQSRWALVLGSRTGTSLLVVLERI